MSAFWVPKYILTRSQGFLPYIKLYGLNPVAVLLVQLYACTNIGTMFLQLDFYLVANLLMYNWTIHIVHLFVGGKG